MLVIDDDEMIQRAIGRSLREHGYDVTLSGSIRDGLRELDAMKELPLVLLDWWLGRECGEDFLSAVEKSSRYAALQIAIMSADPQAAMRYSRAYLPKPFTVALLVGVVRWLERGRWPQPYRTPGGFW